MSEEVTKTECRNIEDLSYLLKMFCGQRLIGHHFTPDRKNLFLHFEEFVLQIDITDAKWTEGKMSVFISPIYDKIPWRR